MLFSKDNLPMAVTPLLLALVVMAGSAILAWLATIPPESPAWLPARRCRFVVVSLMTLSGGWGAMVILPMVLVVIQRAGQ